MANPPWIIGDTDALVQLTAADKLGPLKLLKSAYGIQTVLTEPVEIEIRRIMGSPRFSDVKHLLRRAFDGGVLKVLDTSLLSTIVGDEARDKMAAIDRDGEAFYRLGAGEGEAYSHAASINLRLPTLSNDSKAIRLLKNEGVHLYEPVLRSYDVLVFGVQVKALSHNDCDDLRQSLYKRGDGVHWCFKGCSFTSGLPKFYQRLADGHHPTVGAAFPQDVNDSSRLFVVPRQSLVLSA